MPSRMNEEQRQALHSVLLDLNELSGSLCSIRRLVKNTSEKLSVFKDYPDTNFTEICSAYLEAVGCDIPVKIDCVSALTRFLYREKRRDDGEGDS